MKLYTRSEIIKMLDFFQVNDDTIVEFIDKLTPIELPSDEEIETYINSIDKYHIIKDFYCDGFDNGAKWMRDKIQGGNNEQTE